jgi:hypothetical protein
VKENYNKIRNMHQINYDLALKNIVPILYKNDDKLGY